MKSVFRKELFYNDPKGFTNTMKWVEDIDGDEVVVTKAGTYLCVSKIKSCVPYIIEKEWIEFNDPIKVIELTDEIDDERLLGLLSIYGIK